MNLKKLSEACYKLFYWFAAVGFGILVVLLFVQVFTRNVFNFTSSGIDEFTKFLFMWVMFLGISMAVYRDKHIGIEFFTEKLPKAGARISAILNTILVAVFFGVLVVYGTYYALPTWKMVSPILHWSMGAMYLCVPISGLFSVIFCIDRLTRLCGGKTEEG